MRVYNLFKNNSAVYETVKYAVKYAAGFGKSE